MPGSGQPWMSNAPRPAAWMGLSPRAITDRGLGRAEVLVLVGGELLGRSALRLVVVVVVRLVVVGGGL
ncbi:hypothetical protein GCM10010185_37350 [Saccharothrix coeruleofusca]|uniref:Uncharacterized protein n=1 Tax=Saccharothrix coeruleofusca TaxID=33919 RepID=A0A918AMH7_9PSEU|nr:hypothetical protein GCM10010185_37350 [Saccharothrix coeruleofusca]